MPRSPSGDYSLPLPPVITGTTVEASWANQTLADLQQAMTDSLSRSNQGNMQSRFLVVDGDQSAPGIAFVNEAGTGFYRPDAGDLYLAVLGVNYMRWTDDNGVQLWDGAQWNEVIDSEQLQAAIDGLQSQITTNANSLITGQTFNGASLVSARTAGNFSTLINSYTNLIFTSLKANGPIRQKLNTSLTIDVASSNRHAVTQSGNITLTFTGLPSATDPDLGETYQVEGQVNVWTSTPGTVTINGMSGARYIGEPSVLSNSVSILTYVISRVSGTNRISLVWSAE